MTLARFERIERSLVLDQLALVLLHPVAVPVDVQRARPVLVVRLHVRTAELLSRDVHLRWAAMLCQKTVGRSVSVFWIKNKIMDIARVGVINTIAGSADWEIGTVDH